MKTTAILVPIDFTRAANNTINYVMGLSKQLKTKIVFVHTCSVAYPSSTPIWPLQFREPKNPSKNYINKNSRIISEDFWI